MEKGRGQWASNIGFILAAAGSAVGLGNIWKFPRVAFENGGSAFLLVYIVIVILIGATVMITEFAVGRNAHKNGVGAVRDINKKFSFIGGLGILTGFIILSYYSHVGGWVVKYCVAYLTGAGAVYEDPTNFFLVDVLGMGTSFPIQGAIIYPLIFIGLTAFIVIRGVSDGIEKLNKIMMPSLFVILFILFIRGITIEGGAEGLGYLLKPDFSKVNGSMILAALGQAFFSLSLGMGIMCTYGSYLNKEENLVRNTFTICGLDTLVAFLAGFAMIPIAFATNIEVGQGAGFAFISLAGAFQSMPLGTVFGFLFYVLLFFAALTSSISLLEGTVAFITEEWHWDRKKACIVLPVIMFLIGILYTSSQACLDIKGIWLDANGISYPIFADFMEYLTDKLIMPLCALLYCILVGWIWGVDKASDEISSQGLYAFKLKGVYGILVKFVAPAAIILIMLSGLGFIG
ncbi:MAG: sodium-dependent transporter [Clostridiales bacterium]|uniref:sodium-dependent transporter n=2 Tax=Aminipila sp. TaxID=2060095 RepID=UPI001DEABDAB|nr:sodium-dependent transporter [Aminipila sp.]MBE6034851.1 sodium-dependent transporter [Clostridiales bacterium]